MRRVRITTKLNLLILAVPIVAALAFGVLMRMDRAESLSRLQQAALVRDAGDAAAQLRADLDAVRQDARFLSHLPPICGLLGARAQADSDALDNVAALYLRDRLASLFGAFLRSRPDYLDVRLIGMAAGGGDIVHVVRDGADVHVVMPGQRGDAAAPEDLQAIAALAPGQVHLSDIAPAPRYGDGAVAGPRILRAAVAIHDGQGALFGAIILTQDVGLRLDALQAAVDPAFQLYLVDAGGNALVLPDPAPGTRCTAGRRMPPARRGIGSSRTGVSTSCRSPSAGGATVRPCACCWPCPRRPSSRCRRPLPMTGCFWSRRSPVPCCYCWPGGRTDA